MRTLINKFVILIMALGLLTACSSIKFDEPSAGHVPPGHATQGQIKPISDTTEKSSIDVETAVLEKPKRFSVQAKHENSTAFFQGLARLTEKNIVVHPDIKGEVSLKLQNVTLEDILEVCQHLYGYDYRYEGGVYTIYPRRLKTVIFTLNYPDIKRAGSSDTSILIGKVESNSSKNGSNNKNDENSGLLATIVDEAGSSDVSSTTGTRVQTVTRSDFWGILHDAISSLIQSEAEGGSVFVSPQAGIIMVKAYPDEISMVRRFLEKSELIAQRQVLIEAKIIEVQLSKNFQAGINWSAISGQVHLLKNVEAPQPAELLTVLPDTGETFASIVSINDIQSLLNLLETQGKVQVLSSPRISTVNNQKAVIKVGADEFFVTGISNTTTSNAAAVATTPDVELTSFFSGIALDVTPQISEDDSITLHVHPVITDVQDQLKEFIVGDDKFSLPLAYRDIRESDSIVRANSGQIIVLGGLMKNFTSKNGNKRPFLSSIPIIGRLFFSGVDDSQLKNELVILLKPQVISGSTMDQLLDEQRERLGDFDQLMAVKPKEVK